MSANQTARSQEQLAELLANDELYIETDLSKAETDAYCKAREPWRVVFEFSNGTRTDEFKRHDFIYSPRPLGKLRMFAQHVDLTKFEGKKVLDIGFNEGYHSIFFRKYLNCEVDGIDYSAPSIPKVQELLDFIGIEDGINLAEGDAGTYRKENEYDLILHLGTLYHLPDVWGSIANACASLKPGGTLLLETIGYHSDEDENDCRFINTLNPGQLNYWALSKPAMKHMFAEHGVNHVTDVRDIEVALLKDTGMFRTLMVFEKPVG